MGLLTTVIPAVDAKLISVFRGFCVELPHRASVGIQRDGASERQKGVDGFPDLTTTKNVPTIDMMQAADLRVGVSLKGAIIGSGYVGIVSGARLADFESLAELVDTPILLDFRNIYSAEEVTRHGFAYFKIGSGTWTPLYSADLVTEKVAAAM